MEFTYKAYSTMLKKLLNSGYQFKEYETWREVSQTVILRHDIDYDLGKAVVFSQIENQLGVKAATYFLLVSTDFYNIHSKSSRKSIKQIISNGGKIGLHFDETQYQINDSIDMVSCVEREAKILSDVIETEVKVVSMHRPSSQFLSSDIQFPKIINSYSRAYFKEMKYLSDSRRRWRENIDEIIETDVYPRIHILTHPFWYGEENRNLKITLKEAMLKTMLVYYDNVDINFKNLEDEIERNEIEKIIVREEQR